MPTEQPGVPPPRTGVGRTGRHRPVEDPAEVPAATGRHGTPEPLGARPAPAPRPAPGAAGQAEAPTEPLDMAAARNGAVEDAGAGRTGRRRAVTGTGTHRATGRATSTHRLRAAR